MVSLGAKAPPSGPAAVLLGRHPEPGNFQVERIPGSPEAVAAFAAIPPADFAVTESMMVLAHELRSPIASIGYAVKLLSRQPSENPEAQSMLALIARQARQMKSLVDDLLGISRSLADPLCLQRETLDIRRVLLNSLETVEPLVQRRAHHVVLGFPESPVLLRGDPARLEQVFVNVLANAAKYTPPHGEIRLNVQCEPGRVVIRIRDSGIGIAPHFLPQLFAPFRQQDPAAAASQSGLGIGLALARTLVELHGGSITAASAGVGRGSEFTIVLPAGIEMPPI
jgi:signal transduction histidine kinase